MSQRTLKEILETPVQGAMQGRTVAGTCRKMVFRLQQDITRTEYLAVLTMLNQLEGLAEEIANAPAPDVNAELLAALKPVYDAAECLPGGETASLFDETWNPNSHFPALTLTVQEMRNIVSAVQRTEASQQPSEQHDLRPYVEKLLRNNGGVTEGIDGDYVMVPIADFNALGTAFNPEIPQGEQHNHSMKERQP